MPHRSRRKGSETVIPSDAAEQFPNVFSVINLSEYTTWNIGGPCAAAFVSTPADLITSLEILKSRSIPWAILGRGSNTLAPTGGWHGVVIILSGEFLRFHFQESRLFAGGGAPLPSMAGAACSKGLSGLVFAVGIPGTAGGAVYMNAGAYGSCMSDVIEKVRVFTPSGEFVTLTLKECGFGYRTSIFQDSQAIVTEITLKLSCDSAEEEELRRRAADVLRLRRKKFPLSVPNAGSVFRRPDEGPPPGKLIEDCGLKGLSRGGASVSRIHANFIENRGGATSGDVTGLIETIRDRVMRNTGIELHREIRILGES